MISSCKYEISTCLAKITIVCGPQSLYILSFVSYHHSCKRVYGNKWFFISPSFGFSYVYSICVLVFPPVLRIIRSGIIKWSHCNITRCSLLFFLIQLAFVLQVMEWLVQGAPLSYLWSGVTVWSDWVSTVWFRVVVLRVTCYLCCGVTVWSDWVPNVRFRVVVLRVTSSVFQCD